MNYQIIIDTFYPVGTNDKLRQILLTHSRGVADLALEIAAKHPELQLDSNIVEAAAMLHDIGICQCDAAGIECFGTEPYICHGRLGATMLRENAAKWGLTAEEIEPFARVCERHTGAGLTTREIEAQHLPLPAIDMLPETTLEKVVCYADKFYSKTRPEVRKTYEKAEKSIAKFGEEGLNRFKEWNRKFAV